jgi:hypothetical protein
VGRELRAAVLLGLAFVSFTGSTRAQSLTVLDVPFIAQSELLCGGAAAAMVMRYWGERGVDAESFQALVDRKAGGIRTDALAATLRARRWTAVEVRGSPEALARELLQGRPVISLVEDRPGTYHYVVVVARNADGVIFHDPARAPFRVASAAEFEPPSAATVVRGFERQHFPALEMILADPDGRELSVHAPLPGDAKEPHG